MSGKKSNSVKLKDKVSGRANVYKVRYYKEGHEYIKYTTKNSLTLKNLKKGDKGIHKSRATETAESGFQVLKVNNAGEGKIYIE